MSQLIKYACLGQGKRAVQKPFLQDADLLSIETIETPYGSDALGCNNLGMSFGREIQTGQSL
jgi:hypothetical protein